MQDLKFPTPGNRMVEKFFISDGLLIILFWILILFNALETLNILPDP